MIIPPFLGDNVTMCNLRWGVPIPIDQYWSGAWPTILESSWKMCHPVGMRLVDTTMTKTARSLRIKATTHTLVMQCWIKCVVYIYIHMYTNIYIYMYSSFAVMCVPSWHIFMCIYLYTYVSRIVSCQYYCLPVNSTKHPMVMRKSCDDGQWYEAVQALWD